MFSRVSSRTFSTSLPRAVKVTSISTPASEVSTLKVIVKNAGSKASAPGLAHLLSTSSFLNTESKSGLRLKREAELLGGEYKATVTRDSIILEASFLKEALPFFVNTLGDVLSSTSYKPHELSEIAAPYAKTVSSTASQSSSFQAFEELHAVSFRKGLGNPLYFDGIKSYTSEDVESYAKSVFLSDNIEIVASNVVEADLTKFVSESSFSKLQAGQSAPIEQKSYTGVESRIRKAGPTSAVIGLPIKSSDIATYSLVSAYLKASIPSTYSTTVETGVLPYDSAALFYVSATGSEAPSTIAQAAKLIKSAKDLNKYKALAEFESVQSGLTVELSSAKPSVSVSKFNFVVVGDVDAVPYADEL